MSPCSSCPVGSTGEHVAAAHALQPSWPEDLPTIIGCWDKGQEGTQGDGQSQP